VRDVARPVDEGARVRDDDLASDPERHLAVEHVEPLVLAVMDVQRRADAPRGALLADHDAPAGVLARRLDQRDAAEGPQRLAVVAAEGDRGDRRARVVGHRDLLVAAWLARSIRRRRD
jgi:hypothetical protein